MKIENTIVYGFMPAIRAARNARESWEKSDSELNVGFNLLPFETPENPQLGPKDLSLFSRLVLGGNEHAKFARQIIVWVDWTLPLYMWSEVDTYKVGVIRNSCSTMNSIGNRRLSENDFDGEGILYSVLDTLNDLIELYQKTKSFDIKYKIKSLLPSSYLLKSTMTLNYQVLRNMYLQRRYHRLPQWNIKQDTNIYSICKWIQDLPYAKELITIENKRDI